MDEMMREINKYPNGTYLKVEWEKGRLILDGRIDTVFESNNELDGEDYKEFYACAFLIENIYKNLTKKDYKKGKLIEISIENEPTLITLQDGHIVWKKE